MSVYLLLPYLTVAVMAVLPLSLMRKRSPVPLLRLSSVSIELILGLPLLLQLLSWPRPWSDAMVLLNVPWH